MELTFSNETCTIKVMFYDSMIKLKERIIIEKSPNDSTKHPCKVRRLRNGKYSCTFEFFIPNGFIYDALCIDDDRVKKELYEWINKMADNIKKQRIQKGE